MEKIKEAAFCWRPKQIGDMGDNPFGHEPGVVPIKIERVIELTQAQYQHFTTHLHENAPFIEKNGSLMGNDEQGICHCIMVTARNSPDCILVDSQGYDYARYAAHIQDKHRLDLQNAPVDHYNLKIRESRARGDDR